MKYHKFDLPIEIIKRFDQNRPLFIESACVYKKVILMSSIHGILLTWICSDCVYCHCWRMCVYRHSTIKLRYNSFAPIFLNFSHLTDCIESRIETSYCFIWWVMILIPSDSDISTLWLFKCIIALLLTDCQSTSLSLGSSNEDTVKLKYIRFIQRQDTYRLYIIGTWYKV